MIVVDSSALMAILLDEPEQEAFATLLARESRLLIGAPTRVECAIAASRRYGPTGAAKVAEMIDDFRIETAPLDEKLAQDAIECHFRFGKTHHPAALNFGDCMAYALAKSLDAPLLFKGDDFAKTDIKAAL